MRHNENLYYTFFYAIFPNFLIAQSEEEELGWGVGEIYIATHGLGPTETVRYEMNVVGSFWGGGNLITPPGPFTINYPSYYSNAIAHYIQGSNFIQNVNNTNFNNYNWPYFRMVLLDNNQATNSYTYGLYKLFIEQYDAFFYIDYRDMNYGSYSNCNGHCQDIWLKFEKNEDKFYLMSGDDDANDPDNENWSSIENGMLLKFFAIKEQINNKTTDFQNFWNNCLILIPSQTGNHPRLVWGPYPNENFVLDYYEIYKKKDNSQFQLLTTTTDEDFIDEDEVIPILPEKVVPVWYKVKAIGEIEDDSFVSDYSNTVNINVEGGLSKQIVDAENI